MKKHQYNPDSCIACTSCVAYCPVSAATRKFAGPKMIGPTLERFRGMDPNTELSLEYCANCKNCDISCPSGVPISTLNMLARARHYKNKRHSLLDWMLSHAETLSRLASPLATLANFGMSNPLSKMILKKIGVTDTMKLPAYANKTFFHQFKAFQQQSFPNKVVFFPGCFINYYAPQIGMDFVAVMQKNRFEVIAPDGLECCGSPLVAKGYLDEMADKARKNIQELKGLIDQGYPVITCCTSCSLMLKMEYQELLDLDFIDALAEKTYDAVEFLLELHDKGQLNTEFAPVPGRYLYHAPCHLGAQGIGRPSLDLLPLLPGVQMEDADAGCCGQSGTYGFQDDRHEIAMTIGDVLFQKIKEYRPDAVISECNGCCMQISQATGVATIHPISLLRRSYDGVKS